MDHRNFRQLLRMAPENSWSTSDTGTDVTQFAHTETQARLDYMVGLATAELLRSGQLSFFRL